jgi:hypothetical protein
MKKKYYRKIVIDNKEYDWLYQCGGCDWNGNIMIFEIYYDYHKIKNIDIRRRRFLKDFEIKDYSAIITPMQVEEIIRCNHLLNAQSIRRRKLNKINKLSLK